MPFTQKNPARLPSTVQPVPRKAASQHSWLSKSANRDYFRGPANMQWIRFRRAAHPGYWQRDRPQAGIALQDDLFAQPIESEEVGDDVPPLWRLDHHAQWLE
ncbi:hypothetical protein [Halochromatium glycolicum]|jgi:hypothetical protein|uniref:hypothetical protein n=1 Tax=Halochromatium glycolicum TaxID=85075 RepID=UPI00190951AB|nr:hypothetical protein [Halochromatium glycolicum]